MTLCNYNDQTWFYDACKTSAVPLGVVKTLGFQAWVLTSPSGSNRCKGKENMFDPYSGLLNFGKRNTSITTLRT